MIRTSASALRRDDAPGNCIGATDEIFDEAQGTRRGVRAAACQVASTFRCAWIDISTPNPARSDTAEVPP